MTALVVRGDAARLPLADSSVDLVVTSPPYFGLRSYVDDGRHYPEQIGAETTGAAFLSALWAVTAECVRVLKPTGSLWVNLGDKYVADNRGSGGDRKRGEAKFAPAGDAGFVGRETAKQKSLMGLPWRYAIGCIDRGLILRAEVIWAKPNGMPESVTDRVKRAHETWFHFTTQPRYYADMDEVREAHLTKQKPRPLGTRNATQRHTAATDNTGWKDHAVAAHPLGKLPGSVWSIPTAPLRVPEHLGVDHFAAFPPEWPSRIIRAWCPPGGVVLDPFGGTGTTALAATALGRTGISVDLSSDYCRLARWRTTDPKQLAKVRPPVVQMTLGDEVAS